MSKYDKRGAYLVAGFSIFVLILALCAYFTGCGQQTPPPMDIVAVTAPDCPPDAKFCPTTPESIVPAFGPGTRIIGKLVKPVKGAVLVTDERHSDPRVITMDVPAGTWLVDAGDGK